MMIYTVQNREGRQTFVRKINCLKKRLKRNVNFDKSGKMYCLTYKKYALKIVK